jgi:site-specific DNA recombinase
VREGAASLKVVRTHWRVRLGRRHPTAIFHNTRLKPFADKPEQASVCNPVSQKRQHPFMLDLINERRDIHIQYPAHLLALQRDRQRI